MMREYEKASPKMKPAQTIGGHDRLMAASEDGLAQEASWAGSQLS
jgi:hypothetical protein